ncbi:MAG: hypothetical protein NTV94_06060 [Planctomycetota bacterium]|nr:hypothetical protein [Planctomycetota bacterium]
MHLPWDDWQFWMVSAATLVAALVLLRGILPESWKLRRKKPGTRVSLTIKGQRPE